MPCHFTHSPRPLLGSGSIKTAQVRKIRIHCLAVLVVLASFILTAAVSLRPFERLPHLEDEIAYLYQAKIFAGGQLVIPTPQPRASYWQPFVVDFGGVRFGKYSPGWPLLLAVGVLLGQPWVVNAFLAALTVALTYRLGRDLFGPATGLVAAVLLAASPMFLLLSGSLMAHTAATFFAVLLMWALRQSERRGSAPWRAALWGAVAGGALGMLVNTRPLTAAGIALPLLLAAGMAILRGGWRRARSADTWRGLGALFRAGRIAPGIVSGIVLRHRGKARKVRWFSPWWRAPSPC